MDQSLRSQCRRKLRATQLRHSHNCVLLHNRLSFRPRGSAPHGRTLGNVRNRRREDGGGQESRRNIGVFLCRGCPSADVFQQGHAVQFRFLYDQADPLVREGLVGGRGSFVRSGLLPEQGKIGLSPPADRIEIDVPMHTAHNFQIDREGEGNQDCFEDLCRAGELCEEGKRGSRPGIHPSHLRHWFHGEQRHATPVAPDRRIVARGTDANWC
mmetsp:Transcript_27134/g.74408  ORF Transcript_27134/g.74408 Transcript_27134/m.74408 type:complete len:212 (-) Transcript_27134:121-756(-)